MLHTVFQSSGGLYVLPSTVQAELRCWHCEDPTINALKIVQFDISMNLEVTIRNYLRTQKQRVFPANHYPELPKLFNFEISPKSFQKNYYNLQKQDLIYL